MMNRYSVTAALSAAVFVLGPAMTSAQVQVVESSNRLVPAPLVEAPSSVAPAAASSSSDIFYQLQILQQEVQMLRGLAEEQAYELKRLKQQRLDDYLSLDRRLATIGAPVSAVKSGDSTAVAPIVGAAVSISTTVSTPTGTAVTPDPGDELQRYRTAIDLALSKKDYANAILAFEQYLDDFPSGRYAANSQYWLGEIYLMQGSLEQARERFALMLNEYKDSNKAPDATYKLGVVYHRLGDTKKAQKWLLQAAATGGNAARLAQDYLSKHWP